jgi:nicotinic acid mononucleotide adenylyltransferase
VIGAYPGSFDPPTVAHLAIARAAVEAYALERLDLVVSRSPLDKEHVRIPSLEDRLAVLEEVVAPIDRLGLVVTDHRLLVDIAQGYDVLVMGADKYGQLHDPKYYDDPDAMRAALARLPRLAVVARPPHAVPTELLLDLGDAHRHVSSSAARAGQVELMLPAAAAFDAATGAWTDPERYRR